MFVIMITICKEHKNINCTSHHILILAFFVPISKINAGAKTYVGWSLVERPGALAEDWSCL
ncbi:hypothetical protein V3595_28155 [Bacillus sp. CFBP9009]